MPPSTAKIGLAVLVLGGLHSAATLAGGGSILLGMVSDGWLGSAEIAFEADWERVAVFWSLWFGAVVCMLGWVLMQTGKGRSPLSLPFALGFTAFAALGAAAVPVGGFWLVIGVGVWMVVATRGGEP
jgi:hypothetical protein